MWTSPRYFPVGQCRGQLRLPDVRQRLSDRCLRRQDDRLRRHEATSRVVVIGEQGADVFGLVGVHRLEQPLGLLVRQLAQEVRGIIRLHRLEQESGALQAHALQHALVLAHVGGHRHAAASHTLQ